MTCTTACREGKGVRITWWRHDRRPAGGGRHLLGLGSVGIVAVEENKGADNWKAPHCATALVTLVTVSHCAIALVKCHTAPT